MIIFCFYFPAASQNQEHVKGKDNQERGSKESEKKKDLSESGQTHTLNELYDETMDPIGIYVFIIVLYSIAICINVYKLILFSLFPLSHSLSLSCSHPLSIK